MIFKKLALSACLVAASAFSIAEVLKFEADKSEISSNSTSPYSRLNLDDLENIKMNLDVNDKGIPTLTRLELVFPYADNLIATNFKKSDNKLTAVVRNIWVFREVLVELENDDLMNRKHVKVKLYLVENQNLLNSATSFIDVGPVMFNASAELVDITPNPVADVVTTVVDGKRAILTLYKNPVDENKFQVKIKWLGHGEEIVLIDKVYYDNFDAYAINLRSDYPMPDEKRQLISISYTIDDSTHERRTEEIDLEELMRGSFPQR